MDEHFICGGNCGGVADAPGMCTEATCSNNAQPLTPCACGDKSMHEPKEEVSGEMGAETASEDAPAE